ncbi:preprotein translocase subunit SecE [Vulcanibacillus modesticaldus]|uniref:Protein translocase subunit SecE n=2 Tax=Vulcanibacillus modesticaldus TaxID=337097 RepID=A0A1D2YS63_9BACI|nr:preprotein translocase subunit SecE [Vulcanibacillus modesticaldus]
MRLGAGIKNGFNSVVNFIREGVKELKKVRWPNRKELVAYSNIVIWTVVFITIFFFVIDLGISLILQLFGFGK